MLSSEEVAANLLYENMGKYQKYFTEKVEHKNDTVWLIYSPL